VTAHPTAEWIANQLTAACGWEQVPRYLIRDRDACYGSIFIRRVRSLGIRDNPCRFRKLHPIDSRIVANRNMIVKCSQSACCSSARYMTGSSLGGDWKSKSWSCEPMK
jgi:hypothetical protein